MAIKSSEEPSQIGPLLDALTPGGINIISVDEAVAIHPLASVAVTVYKPESAALMLFIHGVAIMELNPFGPLQLYVNPPVAVKQICKPSHFGPSLVAVGCGNGLTVTTVVAVAEHPAVEVTVTK